MTNSHWPRIQLDINLPVICSHVTTDWVKACLQMPSTHDMRHPLPFPHMILLTYLDSFSNRVLVICTIQCCFVNNLQEVPIVSKHLSFDSIWDRALTKWRTLIQIEKLQPQHQTTRPKFVSSHIGLEETETSPRYKHIHISYRGP